MKNQATSNKKTEGGLKRQSFLLLLANFIAYRFPYIVTAPSFKEPSQVLAVFDTLNNFFRTDIFFTTKEDLSIEDLLSAEQRSRSLSVGDLSILWEDTLTLTESKKGGVFYTPLPVVRHIIHNTITSDTNKEILDPACGSGIFLLEALDFLFSKSSNKTFDKKVTLLQNLIFGVDKERATVEICKILLLCKLFEEGSCANLPFIDLSKNIVCGNSLLSPEDDFSLSHELPDALSWEASFPAIMQQGGFYYIIGNPPYGLKRNEQLSEHENSCLLRKYNTASSGKINKYIAFMLRSYDLLRSGGTLSFIVPNAWLGIDGGSVIRKRFLTDTSLHELITFEKPVFRNLGVETVIFKVVKDLPTSAIKIFNAKSKDEIPKKESFSISHQVCLDEFGSRIPTFWFDNAEDLLRKIRSSCSAITQFGFVPAIALQAYATGQGTPPQSAEDVKNHIYHSRTKDSPDFLPYLEGADITRYAVQWSGSYLKHGPCLAEFQPLERYTRPRIILREILAPRPYMLYATYVDTPYLYNKSVLHISQRGENSSAALQALLTILNSNLGSLIILLKGRKSQRNLFPKIVAADLHNFPIPKDFKLHIEALSALAKERLNAKDNSSTLDLKIDALVSQIYGLSA
ncbi:MAG: Eco57I restriction-modification methylase domain-containing protein [Bdellovibrionota bacterium]|jgi:hypothetical protein